MHKKGGKQLSKTGQKNIYPHNSRKLLVQICVDGINKNFGVYERIEDAIIARDKAIIELNKFGHRFISEYTI